MTPELLQLAASILGAFIAGLIFAWRAKKRLPALISEFAKLVAEAFRPVMREEIKAELEERLTPLTEHLGKVERFAESIERRVWKLEERRRTGT